MSKVIYTGLDDQEWSTRTSSPREQHSDVGRPGVSPFSLGAVTSTHSRNVSWQSRLGVWRAWTARSLSTVAPGGSFVLRLSPFRQHKTRTVFCCCLRDDDDDDDKYYVLHATLPPWSWHVPSQVSTTLLISGVYTGLHRIWINFLNLLLLLLLQPCTYIYLPKGRLCASPL